MSTRANSGTLTTTAATEQDLATVTTAGNYVLKFDPSALAASDTIKYRLYSKVLSGGTERLAYPAATILKATVAGSITSIPFANVDYMRITLECSAGSLSIPWSIELL